MWFKFVATANLTLARLPARRHREHWLAAVYQTVTEFRAVVRNRCGDLAVEADVHDQELAGLQRGQLLEREGSDQYGFYQALICDNRKRARKVARARRQHYFLNRVLSVLLTRRSLRRAIADLLEDLRQFVTEEDSAHNAEFDLSSDDLIEA